VIDGSGVVVDFMDKKRPKNYKQFEILNIIIYY